RMPSKLTCASERTSICRLPCNSATMAGRKFGGRRSLQARASAARACSSTPALRYSLISSWLQFGSGHRFSSCRPVGGENPGTCTIFCRNSPALPFSLRAPGAVEVRVRENCRALLSSLSVMRVPLVVQALSLMATCRVVQHDPVVGKLANPCACTTLSPCRATDSARTGMCMKIKELIRLLERDGWYLDRMRGSHRQFQHPTKPGTVTIAGKLSADVSPGILRSVLKQAAVSIRG